MSKRVSDGVVVLGIFTIIGCLIALARWGSYAEAQLKKEFTPELGQGEHIADYFTRRIRDGMSAAQVDSATAGAPEADIAFFESTWHAKPATVCRLRYELPLARDLLVHIVFVDGAVINIESSASYLQELHRIEVDRERGCAPLPEDNLRH